MALTTFVPGQMDDFRILAKSALIVTLNTIVSSHRTGSG